MDDGAAGLSQERGTGEQLVHGPNSINRNGIAFL
jgi:hypothetical protein